MKYILIALASLATGSFASASDLKNSLHTPCDNAVLGAAQTQDWQAHQDDYNESVIVSVKQNSDDGRNAWWTFEVIAGYDVEKPSPSNSTYKYDVRMLTKEDTNAYGQGTVTLTCSIEAPLVLRDRK